MENLKLYIYALIGTSVLIIFVLFFYKWYTRPKLNEYCGDFNGGSCRVGKCDYITKYETGDVGYCRNTLLGF
ncbi:hypothetical protein COV24_00400 [candidate division WWE3 bacterium CG10_big_fil_rev_8_21_14_0_10_32_10]|uniref:Uncharacterized protein n=1 Tax=candidate division WWE3 bacterium CG10_big_fil_rev_8_21_14_0_10_32_10 TaxID=1975090 RepID=A0A2H0RBK6_UNCKA|nr:MAG: hypothetical protein COV24_00400 [candidate division WWE3 bacterium CG10_big_fil_rev_8_21_14_0_10_32_10]